MKIVFEKESALDRYMLSSHGRTVREIKKKIDSLPHDNPNKAELYKYFDQTVKLYGVSGQAESFLASLELLLKSLWLTLYVIPSAMRAESALTRESNVV